jgi:hypothetical protein
MTNSIELEKVQKMVETLDPIFDKMEIVPMLSMDSFSVIDKDGGILWDQSLGGDSVAGAMLDIFKVLLNLRDRM